jgi:hypothetical protein
MSKEMPRYGFVMACFAFLMLFDIAPVAADKNSSEAKDARTLASESFRRGERFFEDGEFAEAAQAFLFAYETAPHPSVLSNIAVSFDKAGSNLEAVRWYRRYLADSKNSGEDEKIRKRLEELEKTVGELRVTCKKPSCLVLVNGEEQGLAPQSVLVRPGAYLVEGVVEGEIVASARVNCVAGRIMDVKLEALLEEPPVEKEEPIPEFWKSSSETRKTVDTFIATTWIAASSTVVFGGLTIGFAVATKSAKEAFDKGGSVDKDLRSKGSSYKLATNIFLIGTCISAATTIVFGGLAARAKKRGPKLAAVVAPMPGGLNAGFAASF